MRWWLMSVYLVVVMCGTAAAANVILIDPSAGLVAIDVKEDIHFEKPPNTNVAPWQIVRIRLTSEKSFAISWAQGAFTAPFGKLLDELPSATTRKSSDQFGFQWNPYAGTWEFIATTQGRQKE